MLGNPSSGAPQADQQPPGVGPTTALERLPVPYRWLVVGLALLALVSQALEYWLRDPGFVNLQRDVIEGLAFVGVLLFPLIYTRALRQEATRGLAELRPAVLIGDAEYEMQAHSALYARRGVEIVLMLAALGIGLLLFFLPPQELIGLARGQSGGMLILICLMAVYVLVGWLIFILVYTTIRYARGLGVLARRPLAVNVFDTSSLLPFGRLSLLYSLSPFGVVLIPLLLLGPPKQAGGYLMGLLSIISLLLIFIPLWGVHRQIGAARARALANIGQQLMDVQASLMAAKDAPDAVDLQILAKRAEVLLEFRKRVLSGPSWPFQNVGGVARAIGAAISPLAYFILNQLIQTYLFPVLK